MDSLECTINAIPPGNPTEVDVFAGGRFQQKVVYWAEEQLINFPVRNLKPRNDQALILTLIIRNPVTLPNDAGETELYGWDRTMRCVRQHRHRPAEEILERLCQDVRRFAKGAPQKDDVTAVVIKVL